MSRVIIGSIPEKITYVYSSPKNIVSGTQWEDVENNSTMTIYPTFPADSSDKSMISTATQWAENFEYKKHTACFHEVNNYVTNIKLSHIEQRAGGGRAYKALIDNKYYVDVREDVVMDTMLNHGIDIGAKLKGEFLWAKINGKMKLIRIDSELHKLVLEYSGKNNLKPIKMKNLEIGGVYQTKKKEKAIFLGLIDSSVFEEEVITIPINWGFSRVQQAKFNVDFDFKIKKELKKQYLFCRISDFPNLQFVIDNFDLSNQNYYMFEIKGSHSYIEKIDNINLPNNTIGIVQEIFMSRINDSIKDRNLGKVDDLALKNSVAFYSQFLNMCKHGEEIKLYDLKSSLLFI